MIISTFNVQNNFDFYDKSKSENIIKYIDDNKIDIICLQEVFSKCDKDLRSLLGNYNIIGKYRFLYRYKINEKNPIITKHEVLEFRTYHLPSFPSKYRRIITHAIVNYNGNKISIYNTHLEVKSTKIKIKQLNKIYKIIKDDKLPKIIMGDFNLKVDNPLLISFISLLNNLNIDRVPISEKTLKVSRDGKAIDHIFISSDFEIEKINVIKNLNISDHYPILVELKYKVLLP